ncbi:MAG: HGGxSTG domain-containing protein [Pseudomonadota bacterium]
MHPERNAPQPAWMTALSKANNAKRCGAKTRAAHPCVSPAMMNGRCRMHGGKSPGAPCGKAHGSYTYGLHTKENLQHKKKLNILITEALEMVAYAETLM